MCCSVNGYVCLVCCVFDGVCELFSETNRHTFGCGCYFVSIPNQISGPDIKLESYQIKCYARSIYGQD